VAAYVPVVNTCLKWPACLYLIKHKIRYNMEKKKKKKSLKEIMKDRALPRLGPQSVVYVVKRVLIYIIYINKLVDV
jgi:hypothetical protein